MMAVVAGTVGLLLGMVWDRWTLTRSLTGFPDDRGVCGAHKIGGGFWYVVPAALWVTLLPVFHRHEGEDDR